MRKLKQDDKQYGWMAAQVKVNGTGDKLGKDNPSGDVVRKFFQRVDEMSKSWHPGKKSQSVGRPKDMTEAKAGTLVNSAMRIKRKWVSLSHATKICSPSVQPLPGTSLPENRFAGPL